MEQTQQNSRWISAIEFFHLKKSGGSDVSFLRTAAKWPGFLPHTLKAHQEISSTGSPAHLTTRLQLLATYTQHFLGNPLCF